MLSLLSATAWGGELLRNVSFRPDGLDGVLNWSLRGGMKDKLTVLPGQGPGGCDALRVHVPGGRRFSQDGIKLVPGEMYRIGMWVRTKGCPENSVRFMVWNDWWRNELVVGRLPADTGGKWVKMELGAKMVPASNTGLYNFGCYVAGDKIVPFDVAAPYLEPMSEAAVAGSVPVAEAAVMKGRAIPIAPRLADVDLDNPEMSFYYPYEAEIDATKLRLSVAVDGQPPQFADFNRDRRTSIRFARLSPGRHTMKTVVTDGRGNVRAENEYPIEVVSHAYPQGRRLNNFVVELFKGAVSKSGEVAFVNPRRGWVWTSFKPDGGGRERCTMRWLEAGRRTHRVDGAGMLRIHAVKSLVASSVQYPRIPHDWKQYQYGGSWYEKYALPLFNTYFAYGVTESSETAKVFRGLGYFVGPEIGISGASWSNAKVIRERATESRAFLAGCDLELDEHAILNPRIAHYVTAEEMWRVVGREAAVNVFWSDSMDKSFFDIAGMSSEVSSIYNTGRGRGMVYSESYFTALDDWNASVAQLGYYKELVRSLRAISPVGPSALLLCFGGYIEQGSWNNYSSRYADMKVLYDYFMQRFAVDPEFAEIGGAGITAQHHFDEEMMRWFLAAFRHYFLEGNRESLAQAHGFTYRPGHLANVDFEKGFSGWEVSPAADGSLFATNVPGYGVTVTRRDVPAGYGDTLACFVRNRDRPNVLTGKLTGLKPGRLYNVMFYTNDPDDLAAPGSVSMDFPFSVSVSGGDEIPGFAYSRMWPFDRMPDGKRKYSGKKSPAFITRHFLFRARSAEAELKFSDWNAGDETGSHANRRTYLNGICVRPYFEGGGHEDL